MGKPLNNISVEYAYEASCSLVPNAPTLETPGFMISLSINYQLLDESKSFIGNKVITHTSEPSPTMRTSSAVNAWMTANKEAFLLADKLDLSGYHP